MSTTAAGGAETIRLLFELDREDDPRLYDDLIRFKKGTKRINRLRLLAHEAVLGQFSAGVYQPPAPPSDPQAPVPQSRIAGSAFDMPASSDVFRAPLDS